MLARYLIVALLALVTLGWSRPARAEDGCSTVRMSDIGWTDVTATSAIAGELLRDLGYGSRVELLSVPVTFVSLKNGDIDVFLGHWLPAQAADIKPYLEDGSVVVLEKNLEGALFTFAVPKYMHDAGVTSAAHLDASKEKLRGRIYGIEPGGNGTALDLIAADTYGLGDWKLVESSEQGMLGAVSRAVANREWIVFLGWKPHPMNNRFDMEYLADPLEKWGPGGGASSVYTVASKRFVERCPDLVKLFRNLKFTVEMESSLMGAILDEKKEPAAAARAWLDAHPAQAASFTRGVAKASGASGAPPAAAPPAAAPPASSGPPGGDQGCGVIRMSDVGWTDITATTAVAAELLRDLGHESRVDLLSVPVTFASLKNRDIDVFLGNWMPTQAADIKPYLDDGSIVDLGVNLEGALYTFAVPRYVYDAGVTSAAHLAAFKERFQGRIYGIEPGNDGNRIVLDLIAKDTYGLKGWTLVESSEQGMLGEVRRAVANREWIAFLGWKPHPMNTAFEIAYLSDPLEKWGPGGGASAVHTVTNKAFLERCPDLAPLFRNLKFTVEMENALMGAILDEKKEPAAAARAWLDAHPAQVAAWTHGVVKAGVPPAGAPPAGAQAPAPGALGRKIPLGAWIERAVRFVTTRTAVQLRSLSDALTVGIEGMVRALVAAPPWLLIAVFTIGAYALQRRVPITAATLAGCLLIWNLGYWQATLETLVLVLLSTALSVLIGVPAGIAAARRPRLHAALRLLLDLMQTIPTFVYLIPTLMLFGLGLVPGLLSTVIFALPAPIRLTHLGISAVPRELLEAGDAFGARPWQRLLKIELPHALPAILEGVTHALTLSLSMVVIAALVGAGGLGAPVVRALNTVNIGQGFEAGLVIVIVAILLDRTVRPRGRRAQP